MGRIRYCPGCGARVLRVGKYCSPVCSIRAVIECNKQLKEKKGAIYEKWKARLEESLKRV